jgi:DNA-binding MarR family transcriptional regulator
MSPANASLSFQKDSIGVLIGLVRSELVRAMEAELQASGLDLRFTQFLILKRLGLMGPMSASELARSVELDGGAMTRQLDQLEGRGLLRRQPHEQDRRALRIELTPVGRETWKQMTPCNDRVLHAAQKALDATEREQLRDYLERVLHALRDKT